MSKQKIDLSKCKIGQQVKLRDGTISFLQRISKGPVTYPYLAGGFSYTKAGTYWGTPGSNYDIVELIPQATDKTKPEKTTETNGPDIRKLKTRIKNIKRTVLHLKNGMVSLSREIKRIESLLD